MTALTCSIDSEAERKKMERAKRFASDLPPVKATVVKTGVKTGVKRASASEYSALIVVVYNNF